MFYEETTMAMNENKTRLTLVIDDFNATLERQIKKEEGRMKPFFYDEKIIKQNQYSIY